MRRKRVLLQKSYFNEEELTKVLYKPAKSVDVIVDRLFNILFWYEKMYVLPKLVDQEVNFIETKESCDTQEILNMINENIYDEFLNLKRISNKFSNEVINSLRENNFRFLSSYVVEAVDSSNGKTTKLLIALEDGYKIETIILRHKKRTTICVSSQAGCKMGCNFCATGSLGYEANLTSGEILQQFIFAQRYLSANKENRRVSNVVFMGMGEPLNNYSALSLALKSLISTKRLALSPDRVTVSTVGVINNFNKLSKEFPEIMLALSLHASNQELRVKLIPTATAYKLEKLLLSVKNIIEHKKALYPNKPKRQCIMIEYILIRDINDTMILTKELAKVLESVKENVIINLIPYNPIYNPKGFAREYKAPLLSNVENFQRSMLHQGYFCTIRTEMGQDVNGACGQLALVKETNQAITDLEDLISIHKKPKQTIKARRMPRAKKAFPVKALCFSYSNFILTAITTVIAILLYYIFIGQ